MTTDAKTRALAFLKNNAVGTLATVSPEGMPRARTVHYVVTDSFEIFFLTLSGTRKVEDINGDHRAAFVVSDEDAPQTIQIEGTLVEQPDLTLIDPVVSGLMQTLMARGESFAPLTHLDAGNILCYKLVPTWIRWGDFTHGEGSSEVFSVIAS